MRMLAALGLVWLVACGPSPAETEPQTVSVPPQPPLVVPPIAAAAPPPTAAPVATDPPPAGDDTPVADTPTNDVDAARDPLSKRPPRAHALLLTELQQLTALMGATSTKAPDRPMIQKRVADTSFELSRQETGSQATNNRTAAIRLYSDLSNNYPQFAQRDEVVYYWGLSLERNGDLQNARKTYYDLIRNFPQSKYIPYAYFAFGEMFRSESQTDPSKADLARQAYREVVKYPTSPIRPFAQQRMTTLPPP